MVDMGLDGMAEDKHVHRREDVNRGWHTSVASTVEEVWDLKSNHRNSYIAERHIINVTYILAGITLKKKGD